MDLVSLVPYAIRKSLYSRAFWCAFCHPRLLFRAVPQSAGGVCALMVMGTCSKSLHARAFWCAF